MKRQNKIQMIKTKKMEINKIKTRQSNVKNNG